MIPSSYPSPHIVHWMRSASRLFGSMHHEVLAFKPHRRASVCGFCRRAACINGFRGIGLSDESGAFQAKHIACMVGERP